MGEKATQSTYQWQQHNWNVWKAPDGGKKHSGSAKLINTTRFLSVFPLIANHSFIFFSVLQDCPPHISTQVSETQQNCRTGYNCAEKQWGKSTTSFTPFWICSLLAPDLFLPFYSKVHNSPFLDGCIFYRNELELFNFILTVFLSPTDQVYDKF